MKQLLLLLGLILTAAFQSTVAAEPPAAPAAAAAGPVRVQVVTSAGNFTIELLSERAPPTCCLRTRSRNTPHGTA